MDSVITDTNLDLDSKIKTGVVPKHEDKKRLQNRIKQLDKTQQLHLFHNIIKPLDIYTITDNGTFFDLNELTPELFWKLSYQVNLTYDCIKRDQVMNDARSVLEQEHHGGLTHDASHDQVFNRDFDIESSSHHEPGHDNNTELDLHQPLLNSSISYSQLRDQTLSQISYNKGPTNTLSSASIGQSYVSSLLTSEFESKVLERNIYTDKRK